jgi:hypothetical protein
MSSDAVDVDNQGDAIAAREEAARRVNGPYVIDASRPPERPRPGHIKDRIRAPARPCAPTWASSPPIPPSASWVI